MTKNYVVRRPNGNYSFRISVPKDQHDHIGKKEIWESLNTSNRTLANALAATRVLYWKGVFLSYEIKIDSLSSNAQRERAAIQGFEFRTAQEIHDATTKEKVAMLAQANDFLKRIEIPTREQIAANGGVVEDTLSLDEMFSRYQELAAGKWNDLDRRALQKKWNRYLEPIRDFKRAIGDLDVLKITPKDAANYAVDLGKRIKSGEIKSETARKKLLFLNAMVAKVLKSDFPKHENPFQNAEVEHSGNDKTSRRPFSEPELLALHEKLANSKANDELKAILNLMEYTGAIASEIVFLHETDFHLNEEIPYIHIGPNPNRKGLKTENRPRDIPLIGPALEAAKKFPKGFMRYCRSGGSEALSASANKLIQQVSDDTTTYSYRHRFIDWLREVDGMEDSWIKSIIGHDSSMTGKYGKGYSLRRKQDAIQKAMALAEREQKQIQQKAKTHSHIT
ncbi:DUF6538 domain-containing protein [Rhizobium sp. BK661]|uniref:DUF6538 domain-containing protein n=1 Tax=Rhizobium sp. BK661 TaxID=2586991 RepID=UPI0021691588|nr:DUF6538 domain-containing protein [Rhizobium sp. BK661]MCS3743814.1 integrase [Rhizobium sp. BK661]